MAFITINGQEFPAPDNVWELITYTNVTSGRNAQGEFIGDRVGRNGLGFRRKRGRRCVRHFLPLW